MHPLDTVRQISDDYRRYLATTFTFRDLALQADYERALGHPDFLLKGPYLEGTPSFETGASIRELINEGVLHDGMLELDGSALPADRPLFRHQETALRKVAAGRNVVISAGTGSGKTEAFLVPILDQLLRERQAGTLNRPGVRALFLYPMNALANDQLRRLRQLLAPVEELTFGRYTGQTPESEREAEELFRRILPNEPRISNELVSRVRIRQSPPHILLTNYAMLEFLLLRPGDTALFDGPTGRHWRFLVVDEAHVYNGASGAEVGMLLRRLKDRVVASQAGRLRCIATSATLSGGPDEFGKVADFARNLFGETFEWNSDRPDAQDIIEARRADPDHGAQRWGEGSPDLYQKLCDKSESRAELCQILVREGVPKSLVSESQVGSPESLLYDVLSRDHRVLRLQQSLVRRPKGLAEAASDVFGPDGTPNDIVNLVSLCVRARRGEEDAPLLPARYHVFLRALEGAYFAGNLDSQFEISLHRVRSQLIDGRTYHAFELANCFHCGETYIVAERVCGEDGERLEIAEGLHDEDDTPKGRIFTWRELDILESADDSIPAESEATDSRIGKRAWNVCRRCGLVVSADSQLRCDHNDDWTLYEIATDADSGELKICIGCGRESWRSDASVPRVVSTGRDVAGVRHREHVVPIAASSPRH